MSNFRYTRPTGFPPIVKNLIIINVLVWIAQLIYDNNPDEIMWLTRRIALWPINSPEFSPYQVATHMFAHASYSFNPATGQASPVLIHILFNMFALFMFGRILENVWGAKRFLFFLPCLRCGCSSCPPGCSIFYRRVCTCCRGIGSSHGNFCSLCLPFSQYRINDNTYSRTYQGKMGGTYLCTDRSIWRCGVCIRRQHCPFCAPWRRFNGIYNRLFLEQNQSTNVILMWKCENVEL